MMRVPPCDEPRACGSGNCSRPSTRRPAPGQFGERRRAHRTEADHDRVVAHAATICRYRDGRRMPGPAPAARTRKSRERAAADPIDSRSPMSTPPTWPPPPPPPVPQTPPGVPGAPPLYAPAAAAEEVVGGADRGDPDRRGLRRHLRDRHHRGDRHPGAPAGAHERQRSRGHRHDADHGERADRVGRDARRALRRAVLPRRARELRRARGAELPDAGDRAPRSRAAATTSASCCDPARTMRDRRRTRSSATAAEETPGVSPPGTPSDAEVRAQLEQFSTPDTGATPAAPMTAAAAAPRRDAGRPRRLRLLGVAVQSGRHRQPALLRRRDGRRPRVRPRRRVDGAVRRSAALPGHRPAAPVGLAMTFPPAGSPPPPPAFSRPFGVILLGILNVLGALLYLGLGAVLMVVAMAAARSGRGPRRARRRRAACSCSSGRSTR